MSETKLIYAVDDEESIRELYACALSGVGYRVLCFPDGESFFTALQKEMPALALLDIMLEGQSGFDILKRLRSDPLFAELPVIMVSAKGEEVNKVKGLNLGADDYIAKPFGVMELCARIGALLRRTGKVAGLSYRGIEIDESRHAVSVNGLPLSLSRKEYALLRLLLKNAPAVLSREEILSSVWGEDYVGETRTLDMHIASLRRQIAGSGAQIRTVRGVGYAIE